MNWIDFVIRMFAALFFGAAIGLERQWRQRMTGLRINGLVAAGVAKVRGVPPGTRCTVNWYGRGSVEQVFC
jgi:uncharacterized membrane protein YhiD involved in acid resistance